MSKVINATSLARPACWMAPKCYYCRLIRKSDPAYRTRPAIHAISTAWPRCDLHWRFICAVCARGAHFNGIAWCPGRRRFVCLRCAGANRATRRMFWAWSYHYSLACPWHRHWLPSLDFLEFSHRHPWQTDPALGRRRHGLDPASAPPEMWDLHTSPVRSLTHSRSRRAWEEVADWWSTKVGVRGDINREWIIDPVVLRWLGPLQGMRVLDAGSGTGYLSRILAARGAVVTGVEHAARLVEIARSETKKSGVRARFLRSDLASMPRLRSSGFDIAVANVVLQDVTDLRGAVREIARVLRPGGRFVFSITHPCFEAPLPAGKTRTPPDSHRDEDWTMIVDRYFDRVAVFWSDPGKPPVTGYHRPLRDYFEALERAGLAVRRLEEPRPVARALKANFRLFADQERIPNFMIVEAVKPRR